MINQITYEEFWRIQRRMNNIISSEDPEKGMVEKWPVPERLNAFAVNLHYHYPEPPTIRMDFAESFVDLNNKLINEIKSLPRSTFELDDEEQIQPSQPVQTEKPVEKPIMKKRPVATEEAEEASIFD